ncbi:MAG: phospho-N-acetylmuramoyl-pentapeptide-transferase [Firmicutes bacterium]|nr:phospho-N-acetylmuramoyl-pentapeptide-transferase [Bacillota bacterium]
MWYLVFFVAAVALTIIIGKIILPLLVKMKVKQSIRREGPEAHLKKAGTPTMGGLIFIAAALICCIFLMDKQPLLWVWLFSFLSFGLIGFLDDFAKLRHHQNLGLNGKQKLVAQFAAVGILLFLNEILTHRGTCIDISATAGLELGWFYYPLIAVFVVGMVNAVNLTDGLDGLAAGCSFFTFAGYALIGFIFLGAHITDFAQLPYIALIMAGCCLGFLFFNHYPAKVFMGDTGSMALGGAVTGLAVTCRLELVLLGLGLVYLIEALSVMLQVVCFKLTGKRIFRMSPLHHHFEQLGWKETKVTAMFYLASAVIVVVTVVLFRIIRF